MKEVSNTSLYLFPIPELKDGWCNYQIEVKKPFVIDCATMNIATERKPVYGVYGSILFYIASDTEISFEPKQITYEVATKLKQLKPNRDYFFIQNNFYGLLKFNGFEHNKLCFLETKLPRCYVSRSFKKVLLPNETMQYA